MVVVYNQFSDDTEGDGGTGSQVIADDVISGASAGPVPSPWRVTSGWVVDVATTDPTSPFAGVEALVSTGVGRCTVRADIPPPYYFDMSQILTLPTDPDEPFLIIYDETDAGGVGNHAYLTRTSVQFSGGHEEPLGFTITDEYGSYFGGAFHPLAFMAVNYDDHAFAVAYYPKGGYNYDTGIWTIRIKGIDLVDLHAVDPSIPDALPRNMHMGFIAQRSGIAFGSPSVFADGFIHYARPPRYDL